MIHTDIARLRIINQHIAGTTLVKPEDVVAWMGAMQAQDYAMVKWGIGVRLPGSTDAEIEKAIDEGRILRTHVLRPTWHLVAAEDLGWMMGLTGPRLRGALNANNKTLELTEAVFVKCNRIMTKALSERHMTRKELAEILGKNKIATDGLRLSHILFRAEIEGVACSGARVGKENTYALFEERVPPSAINDRNKAVGELFRRYMVSHGPATLMDFAWWSGLALGDARTGLEMNRAGLDSISEDGKTWWFANRLGSAKPKKGTIHLLPAFDEYLVAYKDRSASLRDSHFSSAISSNGIFRPAIVFDGKVAGIWKRAVVKGKLVIGPSFFEDIGLPARASHKKAAAQYARFLNLPLEAIV